MAADREPTNPNLPGNTTRRLSRGQFLLEMGLLASGGLLAACSEPTTSIRRYIKPRGLNDKLLVATRSDEGYVFSSYLWLANADGSNQVLLEASQRNRGMPHLPAWSRNRDKFLIPPGSDWSSNIVYGSAGDQLTVVTEGQPFWSVGDSVVYATKTSREGSTDGKFIAQVIEKELDDGRSKALAQITDSKTFKIGRISISPDGQKIAVGKSGVIGTSLEIFDYQPEAPSDSLNLSTTIPVSRSFPAPRLRAEWTPDSRELVYELNRSIQITNIETLSTKTLALSQELTPTGDFSLSSDGSRVAVASPDGLKIYDAGSDKEVVIRKGMMRWVSWLNDNQHVIFHDVQSGTAIMNTQTKSVQQVSVAMNQPDDAPKITSSDSASSHPFGGRVSGRLEKLFWDLFTAEARRYR